MARNTCGGIHPLPVTTTMPNQTSFAQRDSGDALRHSMKDSVRSIEEPPDLVEGIEERIRRHASEDSTPRWGAVLSIAAAMVVCAGTVIAYQQGYLRPTQASRDSYISSISRPITPIMRAGLGDHVHCAVFGKKRGTPPSVEQIAREMGADYKGLVEALTQKVPREYQLTSAHRCRYNGRQFVHITVESDSALVSLVISRRASAEVFDQNELAAVLPASGIPVYQSSAQRLAIAGFAVGDHLAYVVSDLDRHANLQLMMAVAPRVRDILSKLAA